MVGGVSVNLPNSCLSAHQSLTLISSLVLSPVSQSYEISSQMAVMSYAQARIPVELIRAVATVLVHFLIVAVAPFLFACASIVYSSDAPANAQYQGVLDIFQFHILYPPRSLHSRVMTGVPSDSREICALSDVPSA